MCTSFGQYLEIFFEANGFDISISELKITFGIHKTAEINANLKNFLIFTAKYFIFVCKYRNCKYRKKTANLGYFSIIFEETGPN